MTDDQDPLEPRLSRQELLKLAAAAGGASLLAACTSAPPPVAGTRRGAISTMSASARRGLSAEPY